MRRLGLHPPAIQQFEFWLTHKLLRDESRAAASASVCRFAFCCASFSKIGDPGLKAAAKYYEVGFGKLDFGWEFVVIV